MDSGSLYHAVVENNVDRLIELLEQGGNVDEFYEDTMNISSKSLLHICCGKGHTECLKVLIQHGAQLTVRDKWGQTPLMYSVSIQFPEIAKVLLDADAELVKCQDKFGKSPLHCAVETGSEELVRLLLEYGADVNIRCHEGLTPLMNCCTQDPDGGRTGVMKILLEAGAMFDLTDYRGKRTALHVAVLSGNAHAVELLIGAGADVNNIDKTLHTPLTLALGAGVRGPVINENFMRIISLLVSAGAQLNISICESCNPLLTSALLRSDTMVRYFLSLGVDSNIKFPSGVTPALVCASTGDLATLRTLLYYNCDLTIKGNVYKKRRRAEFTLDPFELAYMEGYLDVCVLMVRVGYRVHGKCHIFARDLGKSTPTTSSDTELTLLHCLNLPPDYKNTLQWLAEMACNPRMLRDEAVAAIRRCLRGSLVGQVKSLPLPQTVKNYVLLTHILN
ncbi:unnamed protein product [Lymnaea stagnalis]|uniref:SOCS box domain-containing protein n=1 Tax=Lymnaea stagnalis TaxID=6523 RepID=A0AAV2IF54_LYMST